MSKYKLSIIVSTYNQPNYLEFALSSLSKQDNVKWSDVEVIIADDGSKFDTKSLVEQFTTMFPCKLLHIWHEDSGFRKAMILNKAVAASSGEYLIFIDGDCVVPTDFLEQQLCLKESGFFVAGNRVLLSERFTTQLFNSQSLHFIYWGILEWLQAKIIGKVNKFTHVLRLNPVAKWRKSRQNDWKYPKGCNIGIKRDDYISVNGYDESFTGWGHEDADFFIRLLHSGVKIKDGRFAAPVYHLWHKLNSRDNEVQNKQMLLEREKSSIIKAVVGINQYLSSSLD